MNEIVGRLRHNCRKRFGKCVVRLFSSLLPVLFLALAAAVPARAAKDDPFARLTSWEQGDDGKAWREVARVENRSKRNGDSDLLRFQPVKARYVRLHCTEPAVNWQHYCIYEFAVYEKVSD